MESQVSRVSESSWDLDRLSIIQGVVVAAAIVPSHWAVKVVSKTEYWYQLVQVRTVIPNFCW